MNKLGRNDPCSCGSGKKYKKCCADADAKKMREDLVDYNSPLLIDGTVCAECDSEMFSETAVDDTPMLKKLGIKLPDVELNESETDDGDFEVRQKITPSDNHIRRVNNDYEMSVFCLSRTSSDG